MDHVPQKSTRGPALRQAPLVWLPLVDMIRMGGQTPGLPDYSSAGSGESA